MEKSLKKKLRTLFSHNQAIPSTTNNWLKIQIVPQMGVRAANAYSVSAGIGMT